MKVLRTLILWVTFIGALASSSVCSAYFYTGQDLKKWLDAAERLDSRNPRDGDYNDGFQLLGYLGGVIDSLDSVVFCTPAGFTMPQATAIVRRYVKEHPERWHEPADVLVVSAINQQFPCATSGNP